MKKNPTILATTVSFLVALTIVANVAAQTMATNPIPFVNEPLVPDAVRPGGTGFTLTINGRDLFLAQ